MAILVPVGLLNVRHELSDLLMIRSGKWMACWLMNMEGIFLNFIILGKQFLN